MNKQLALTYVKRVQHEDIVCVMSATFGTLDAATGLQ